MLLREMDLESVKYDRVYLHLFLGSVFLLSLTWVFEAWYTVSRVVWLMITAFIGIFMAGLVIWLRSWFAVTRGITCTLRIASALFLVLGFIWMLKVNYLSLMLIMFAFVGAEYGLVPSASVLALPILFLSFTAVYFFASLKLKEAKGRDIAFYVVLCLLGMLIGIFESQLLPTWPSAITWLRAVYVGVNIATLALIIWKQTSIFS